jgi:hypothetical protein
VPRARSAKHFVAASTRPSASQEPPRAPLRFDGWRVVVVPRGTTEVRTFHVERALDALGFAERRSRTDHAAGGSSSWVPRISRRSTWNGPSIGFGGVRLVSAPTDRQRSEATVRRRRHPQAAFWHAPAGEAVVPRRPQLDAATATRTRIRIGLSTAVGRACSSADRHQPPVEPPWSRQPAPRSSPRRQHPRPWCTKSALRAAAGPVRMLTSR